MSSYIPLESIKKGRSYILHMLDSEVCETLPSCYFLVTLMIAEYGHFAFNFEGTSIWEGILPIHRYEYFDEDYGETWGLRQIV